MERLLTIDQASDAMIAPTNTRCLTGTLHRVSGDPVIFCISFCTGIPLPVPPASQCILGLPDATIRLIQINKNGKIGNTYRICSLNPVCELTKARITSAGAKRMNSSRQVTLTAIDELYPADREDNQSPRVAARP